MRAQDLKHVLFVILAADGEDVAVIVESEQILLKSTERDPWVRFTEVDSVRAILPENTTPKCVVQIQNDALQIHSQRSANIGRRTLR